MYHEDRMWRATTLKQRALEIGFDLAGIAPLSAWEDLGFSQRWVEQGYGGEMRYLANPKRDDPRRILPSAKSVVCVGLVYNAPLPYSTEVGKTPERVLRRSVRSPESSDPDPSDSEGGSVPSAWVSRYAWGRDYHEVMRAKLERLRSVIEAFEPGVETRVYVDTGPIVERAFARYSGIGWTGKNTCLINEAKGSWFFIGVILTSLDLEPDLPAPDRCGSCTRCIEACPTGALVEPYVMDASRCIAYFTIELKGPIPAKFRPAIGSNVFGCDICQDVCPWNGGQAPAPGRQARQVATTDAPGFQPLEVKPSGCESSFSLFNPPIEGLASLTLDEFRRIFARSPIKRAKYRGWLRNLCVAMGNSGDQRFAPWLERARQHPDAVVREHAEWALEKLIR
jgi:epoxyqueuosine reductase